VLTVSLNLNTIQCCQPVATITVSYKPNVGLQKVQTSERKHIFNYALIDWIFKKLIKKTDAWPIG